ncbi:MAG: PstS family phosphate ABC transporter substrate-binding protein [Oligoflexales bacterium]
MKTSAFSALALSIASLASVARSADMIKIDGSSTVYPITEAVAEEFGKEAPKVRVTVGVSGTGGGFKKFCAGEVEIADASRTVKTSELQACKAKKISLFEIPVAFDGISVVVNKKNDWVDTLTTEELTKIWGPGSKVKMWSDIRPNWPKRTIKLYGPGTDSGTFDYFTEAINGKAAASRSDFVKSEDDNVLVKGIAGDLDSLGYFGYAYFQENKGEIRALDITHEGKKVAPSTETIKNGTYKPLGRKVYIYANVAAAKENPQIFQFIKFYLDNAEELVKDVGYVPLEAKEYKAVLGKFENEVKNHKRAS